MSLGLPCPHCGELRSKIVDSRPEESAKRRRRQCIACKFRYTTREEYVGLSGPMRQPVDVQKVSKLLENASCALFGKDRPTGIPKIVFTQEMDDALRDCHAQGLTQAETGDIIGVAASVIARRKRDLGIAQLKPWAAKRALDKGGPR